MIFEDDEGPPRTEPWPPSVIEELNAATARFVRRKVVLDMVDEIPDELMECVGKQLRELIGLEIRKAHVRKSPCALVPK